MRPSTPERAGEGPAGAVVPTDSPSVNAVEVKFGFLAFSEVRADRRV